MVENQPVSVIIPTLATKERARYLLRAIDSVISQTSVPTIPIIIANGLACDPGLLDSLRRRKDIRFRSMEQASQPAAIKLGRDLVDTRYFAILDDDDFLLPHAMTTRLSGIQAHPAIDVVVTSGILCNQGHEVVNISDFSDIQSDPLTRFLQCNWMMTGAGLFRTATVPSELFDGMPQYLEWTYLAVRLCVEKKKILFMNNPTVVHFGDHEFGIDKSRQATLGRPRAFERILQLDLPTHVRLFFETQLAAANHAASKLYLKEYNFSSAWSFHLKTLRCRSGWKHLFYLRDFIKKGSAFLAPAFLRSHDLQKNSKRH
ncbi:MAG: glycosyltransferase family A protein [Desulfobacteraceae bacterium]